MTFDKHLEAHVGKFGRFQAFCLFALVAPGIVCSMSTMELVFVLQIPDFFCHVSGLSPNDTDKLGRLSTSDKLSLTSPLMERNGEVQKRDACQVYDTNFTYILLDIKTNGSYSVEGEAGNLSMQLKPCSQWGYDESVSGHTLVSKFGMICDRTWLQGLTKSCYLVGQLIGVLIGGALSDQFGRRAIGRISIFLTILVPIVMAFSPFLELYLAVRIIDGACNIILYSIFYILCNEMLSPEKRAHAGTAAGTGFFVGGMLLPLMAWLLPNWKHLTLANAAIKAVLCSVLFLLPESPRWLYNVGKYKQAKETLEWMAKINKRKIPAAELSHFVESEKEEPKGPGCWFFVHSPLVVVRLALTGFLWFSSGLIFYGISLNVGGLAGNIYINMLLMAIMDIPGCCFIFFIVNSRLGRRLSIFFSLIICVISLFTDIALPRASIGRTILAIVGKLAINIAFNALYILTPELFPTGMRATALGTVSAIARVGSSISPFVTLLPGAVPAVFFGLVAATATICILALPETKGRLFPMTVEDMKNQKSLLCPCLEKPRHSNGNEASTNGNIAL